MEPKVVTEVGEVNIAVEVCILHADKVLMQKRSDKVSNFPNTWTFPGGRVDENEDFLTAAIREVKEETGIVVKEDSIKLKVSAINHHQDKNQVWIVMAFLVILDSEQKIISCEEGDCEWIVREELLKQKEKIFPPIEIYLDHILNDESGILYMSGIWEKAKLVKLTSWVVDKSL
jgi:8-oxo-dGTP diphosphatase